MATKRKGNGRAAPGQKRAGEKPAAFRKPSVEFTEERKVRFLEAYRQSGMLYLSARHAGVCQQTVANHRAADKPFDAACEHALQERLDEIELTALDRAMNGVAEPVIGGKDRDQVITTIRRYSDSLMSQILRAKRIEYREKLQADVNIKGGVLVLPTKPQNDVDWEKEHGEAARGQTGKPAQ